MMRVNTIHPLIILAMIGIEIGSDFNCQAKAPADSSRKPAGSVALYTDPGIEWGTYLGGASGDGGSSVAIDASGNIYAVGESYSAGWVSGGWDSTYSRYNDGYVVKLDSTGSHVWSTYLGGSDSDSAYSVVVDPEGNIYIAGRTVSSFWISGGWDETHNGGYGDGFVVKLSSAGEHVWSTYIGGNSEDTSIGLTLDASGNLYVCGDTKSAAWVNGGWDTTFGGGYYGYDGYLLKLDSTGNHVWSTFLGDDQDDYASGIDADQGGHVYVGGKTSSANWINGGWKTTPLGGADSYLAKFTADGLPLWSTYIGGISDETGNVVALDDEGSIYLAGSTKSAGWVSGGWRTVHTGDTHPDGYLVKLNSAGNHQWSTYLGGDYDDYAYQLAVSDAGTLDGSVYVIGRTSSPDWVGGGWKVNSPGGDAFLAKLNRQGVHQWSSYLGGDLSEYGAGVVAGPNGTVVATGTTSSPGWISGGWDTMLADGGTGNDGFVVKILDSGAKGSLRIQLEPVGAVNDGAQWRIRGTETWRNSGDVQENLSAGQWQIEFKDLWGWAEPKLTATVAADGISVLSAAFVPREETELTWGTYLGGTGNDGSRGVAVDADGNVYAAGSTNSSGWVSGGWNTSVGSNDGYVVKLKSTGEHVWSTFIGGDKSDSVNGVVVGNNGNVCVTGSTYSSGWISGGWDTTFDNEPGYYGQAFVVKLNRLGAHLWSTYIGGPGYGDAGLAIAVDGNGNICVTGYTSSLWASGGWRTIHGGNTYDGFLVRFDPTGAHLWSTYLGGTGQDYGYSVDVDNGGRIFVTGLTLSPNWVEGGWDTTWNGEDDAFVVKFSSAGVHKWSSYLGGKDDDSGYDIVADDEGNIYVAGATTTSGWLMGGWDTTWDGSYDGFLVKMSSTGFPLWSTYLGGTGSDSCSSVALDSNGNVFVTGTTPNSKWVSGGWDESQNGSYDGFLVKFTRDGKHTWSSYLGATGEDYSQSVAVSGNDSVYVTGTTKSSNWLTGGWDDSYNGMDDGFLIRIGVIKPETAATEWARYR